MAAILLASLLQGLPATPVSGQGGAFGGGSGTLSDPYVIEDAYDLQNMNSYLSAHFALGYDIDASMTAAWNGGAGFIPIGTSALPFTGSLDGRDRTIVGLTIVRPASDDIGLFGFIGKGGVAMNIKLSNAHVVGGKSVGALVGYLKRGYVSDSSGVVNVSGTRCVGGLVGQSEVGPVNSSHASGSVSGPDAIGGLVGASDYEINDCYASVMVEGGNLTGGLVGDGGWFRSCHASGDVTGTSCVGGIVGHTHDILFDSYSTGNVTGNGGSIGGLAGDLVSGRNLNSFYDVEKVLINGGHHLTAGGIFDDQYRNWMSSGRSLAISDYASTLRPVAGAYEVSTVQGLRDLLGFSTHGMYQFVLTSDVDLASDPGLYIPHLEGVFDGAGHNVSNLSVDLPFSGGVGLVGAGFRGAIKDLHLIDARVVGGSYVGGLVGSGYSFAVMGSSVEGEVSGASFVGGAMGDDTNGRVDGVLATCDVVAEGDHAGGVVGHLKEGTVTSCSADGNVSGRRFVGGLIGYSDGDIYHCSARGSVNGTGDDIGGLVGFNAGTIESSQSTASVVGEAYNTGGLAGYNQAPIFTSYADGSVMGFVRAGGLIGYNRGGYVFDSYSKGPVSGDSEVGGLDGGDDQGTLIRCFAAGTVSGDYNPGGLVGYASGTMVTSCFWDTQTSGQPSSAAGTGATTAQMMTRSTFSDVEWNFTGTWFIIEHASYPILRWQDGQDPKAEAGPDIDVALGVDGSADVALDGSSSSDDIGILSYEWTVEPGGTATEGRMAVLTLETNGTFTIKLTVIDHVGKTATDTMVIRAADVTPPIAEAGPDRTVYEDAPLTLYGSASKDNVGIADWCWTFTDKTPVELHGTSASHVFDTPGVYLVTLLVVDRAGNRATDTTSVMVRDKTPPVAEAGQDRVVTMGDEVAFDGSASADNLGIVGLIWTFTDGVPVALDGSNPSHRFNKPGVFVVTLNVTDAAGHWATDTLTVTVVDATPPTAEAGSDQQVAAGTAVQLDGSLSTDNLGVSGFSWTFTYGSKAQRLEGRTVQFTFEEEGVYEIHLEVSDLSGNKGNDTVAITVVDIGSVTGTVLDQDGHPVEGALVELIVPNGTIRSATSGTDGSFALDVHHGSFVWRVSKDGYSTVSGNSSVAAMGARELDLPGMPLMKKAGEGPSGPDLIVPMALIIVVVVGLALVLLLRRRRGGGGA